jgi:hypothetical protein
MSFGFKLLLNSVSPLSVEQNWKVRGQLYDNLGMRYNLFLETMNTFGMVNLKIVSGMKSKP